MLENVQRKDALVDILDNWEKIRYTDFRGVRGKVNPLGLRVHRCASLFLPSAYCMRDVKYINTFDVTSTLLNSDDSHELSPIRIDCISRHCVSSFCNISGIMQCVDWYGILHQLSDYTAKPGIGQQAVHGAIKAMTNRRCCNLELSSGIPVLYKYFSVPFCSNRKGIFLSQFDDLCRINFAKAITNIINFRYCYRAHIRKASKKIVCIHFTIFCQRHSRITLLRVVYAHFRGIIVRNT